MPSKQEILENLESILVTVKDIVEEDINSLGEDEASKCDALDLLKIALEKYENYISTTGGEL